MERQEGSIEGARDGEAMEVSWKSGMNESREEVMMGGKTGGRSHVDFGTSGGGVKGTGFGDGIRRKDSPDAL